MNTPNQPFKKTIGGKPVICDPALANFDIHKQSSSYVDYYATNKQDSEMFFQFNNGACFVFADVPAEVQEEAIKVPSIGKFYHASIKAQYQSRQLDDRCIKPYVTTIDEDEDDEDLSEFNAVEDWEG